MNNIIEGMNVLEQTPIKEYTALSNILVGLGLFVAIVSVAVLMFKTRDTNTVDIKSKMFKRFLCCYVFGLVLALFSIIHFPCFYTETGRYTYKCELEDGVSANFISENFNIISIEDDIWTIGDK